jgi:hypothetical protein
VAFLFKIPILETFFGSRQSILGYFLTISIRMKFTILPLFSVALTSTAPCVRALSPRDFPDIFGPVNLVRIESLSCFRVVSFHWLTKDSKGYATHIPTYTNTTITNITYATYANIRFAQPPTGELRFRKPVTPPLKESRIQDGKYTQNATDCLIATPSWYPLPGINETSWGREDCLFLDVKVPEGIKAGDKVPVLHWFFGAGVSSRTFEFLSTWFFPMLISHSTSML